MENFSRMVSKRVCLTKKHCHCHATHHIPEDDEKKSTVELSSDMYHVGETLLYTDAGHTTYVRVEKIFLDENAVLRFIVCTKDEETIETTKESLRAPDAPDVG